jgi:uncharacterized membrane protein required for colicin V production
MLSENKQLKRQLLISGILALLIFLAGLNSSLVEQVYSRLLYKYLSVLQRSISRIFPFSLGDLLYLLFIAFMLYRVYKYLRKLKSERFKRPVLWAAPLGLLNFALILYIAFKLLWGLNYSRPSIAQQLKIGNEKYSPEQLTTLANFLIKQLNSIQLARLQQHNPALQHYSAKELEQLAASAYQEMQAKNPFFSYHQPALKKVLNTWAITKIGLEGYYNPLSGEANVNMMIPSQSLPFVACHEIAHQLGVGREDEANLVGYLVAANSSDLNFKYSAVYSVLRNVLFEVRIKSPEQYEQISARINEETILDFKRDREFWMKYNSDMYAYMDVALDSFLKLNNQQKGINSYQDIVIWVYNLHKQEL